MTYHAIKVIAVAGRATFKYSFRPCICSSCSPFWNLRISVLMKVCLGSVDVRTQSTLPITYSDEGCWKEEKSYSGDHSHWNCLLLCLHGKVLHLQSHCFHASCAFSRLFCVEFARFGASMLQYTAYLCDAVLVYVYAIVLSFLLLVFWKVLGGCITANSCGLPCWFHRPSLGIYQKISYIKDRVREYSTYQSLSVGQEV